MAKSPSPCPAVAKRNRRRPAPKKAKSQRKPTHWMTLVKATFEAGSVKGSEGLTEAMKKAKCHLPAFKCAHPNCVPSVEVATAWIRPRL